MIKKGDNVIVIAGSDKGKKGTVQMIVRATNRAVVEGINVKKKHEKPKTRDAKGADGLRRIRVHRQPSASLAAAFPAFGPV